MVEIIGIGIRVEVRDSDITLEKTGNLLRIRNKKEFSSDKYDLYKKDWKCKLHFGDKIRFLDGDNIYLYDFEYLNQKDKIFSRSEVIYLGLNLKFERELTLIRNKYYILSPSSRIKIGKGKVSNDREEFFVNEDTIIRDILRVVDGLLIRKPLEV